MSNINTTAGFDKTDIDTFRNDVVRYLLNVMNNTQDGVFEKLVADLKLDLDSLSPKDNV